jgi:hypothetical protein
MASKASKLQSGVHSASRGLFSGMTRLDEQSKKDNKDNKADVKAKETATEKATETTKPVKEALKESVKEAKAEPVTSVEEKEVSTVEETVQQISEQGQSIERPEVQQPVQNQIPVQTNPVAPQPQVQTYTQPVQPQAYQQPVYSYQQPVNTMPQMPYTQPVQATPYNEPSRPAKAEKGEKNSRYEKDKFLLLDIRGLRDYVEHMAKASNMSATKYIRSLIEKDWAANNDIYMAHKALEEQLKQKNSFR